MRLPSSEHKPTAQNDKKTARRYRLAVLDPLEQKRSWNANRATP